MALRGLLEVLVFALFVSFCFGITLTTYITKTDKERLKSVFSRGLLSNNLETLAKSAQGLVAIDQPIVDFQKACESVKKYLDVKNVASIYHASVILDALKSAGKPCQLSLENTANFLTETINTDNVSAQSLFQSISALKTVTSSVPVDRISKALDDLVKLDESPLGYAYIFKSAIYLGEAEINKYHNLIEDIIAQADEIDDEFLQFEGGPQTTAMVLHAVYLLSSVAKIQPTISDDKVIKLISYLLQRKNTDSISDASLILQAIKIIASNKFHVPIAISLASKVSLSKVNPVVKVQVTDIMGQKIEGLSVVADTARHIADNAVILSKKSLSPAQDSTFDLDLMSLKPPHGFYKIVISASSTQQGVKLLGNLDAEVRVKVVTQVSIDNFEISISDKEQGTVIKTAKVQQPNKITLEADYHQKLVAHFQLSDKESKKSLSAHQTFVRMLNERTKHDVFFVAEADGTDGAYKFDLDVASKSKDFNHQSGKYILELIVGDALIENTVSWNVADVKLIFTQDSIVAANSDRFSMKPDINHLFREPEKRPPSFVSNLFTVLVLLPILILFGLWIKIGVNLSNFPLSLSAILFHVCLSGIFVLYFFYFIQLNMFTTLKYLALLSIPTFLSGHRLLSFIAAKRK